MASPHEQQFNFLFSAQYSGGAAFSQMGKDTDTAGKNFKRLNDLISGEMESASKATGGASVAIGQALGVASIAVSTFAAAFNFGKMILDTTKSLSWYHDEMIQTRIATEFSTQSTLELRDQQMALAQSFGTSAERAMKLQSIAGQMKIRAGEFGTFVSVAEKSSKVLGLSVEQASQMNYQMSRIPGFIGHYEQLASAAKRVTQQFNVKPEELLASFDASNPDVARILLSIPEGMKTASGEAAREVAMKQLMGIEGSMKQMGRAGGEIRKAFVQMMSPDNEQGNLLAARIAQVTGKSVQGLRNQMRSGTGLTETYGDFLKLIESMSETQISELADTWGKASGISSDALAVLRLQLSREKTATLSGAEAMVAAIGKVTEATGEAGKPTKTLNDYWEELNKQISIMTDQLVNPARTKALQILDDVLIKNEGNIRSMVDGFNKWLPKIKEVTAAIGVLLTPLKKMVEYGEAAGNWLWEHANQEKVMSDLGFDKGVKEEQARQKRFEATTGADWARDKPLMDEAWARLHAAAAAGDLSALAELSKWARATIPSFTKGDWANFISTFNEETTGPIAEMAAGGLARARAGGTTVKVAEAGEDEAIIPLSRIPSLVTVHQEEVVAAIKWLGGYLAQALAPRSSGFAAQRPGLSPAEQNFLGYRG